ncbi:IS21 family transposase [Ornithinibacter sp.]|uniref:IS21 family transposase n=1 Tax=Ornithinibacter sp. TaxID=2862748 RepID=UPI002CA37594|nr:IS21 family transposase [Ornithinibacter sp.]HQV46672.1 IS21 family transposase [Nitrospira sp.]HRA27514.1 IS21 family transposase [Ornithinibacter sp.]
MAFLEVHMVQVREIIRRWQAGENKMAIGRASGVSARTVGRYIEAAASFGLTQDGEPPGEDVLAQLLRRNHPGPLPTRETPAAARLAGREEQLARWLQEERLQLTRVHELLIREGVTVSYTSLRRYVREAGLWKPAPATLRMADWPPGEVAEMDFGRLGSIIDAESGKKQTVWALLIVLPYSRHCFAWPLLQQTLAESIAGLEAAWQFFGGVPKRLILDNFSAAIAGPDALEPRPTRGFIEYSQERGFLCDPARVRRPKDKPHVERGIQYLRERFFKGGSFRSLDDCREQAERWCSEVAGLRVHGTTRQLPREVFETDERQKLQPYDGVLYDVPEWKEVTVHPDHHVSFGQALYSVPATTCTPGTKLEVRGDRALVKLYKKGELMKVHPRQQRGGRATDPNDYPVEKTAYALRAPDRIVRRASELGPNVGAFAQKLFEGPLPWAKLRAGQKLVSLGERYGGERLDAACQRSLAYDLVDVRRVQRILLQALDRESPPIEDRGTPLGSRFARPGSAFDHHQTVLQEATA